MTVKEAAARLGCSPATVYRLMSTRQIGYHQRGRRRLPDPESVEAYCSANFVPPVRRVRPEAASAEAAGTTTLFKPLPRRPG